MHLVGITDLFSQYAKYGSLTAKQVVAPLLTILLGEKTVITDLPSSGKVALYEKNDGYICHLWYANTVKRVTGYDLEGYAKESDGFIHLINSGADVITLCSMLRIPVCMHNVDEEKIYRPAVWGAFGMDKEGQDFRACKEYGPLYKTVK